MRVDLRFEEFDLGAELVGLQLGLDELAFCPFFQKEISDCYTLNDEESQQDDRLELSPAINIEVDGFQPGRAERRAEGVRTIHFIVLCYVGLDVTRTVRDNNRQVGSRIRLIE